MKKIIFIYILTVACAFQLQASSDPFISTHFSPGSFPVFKGGKAASILISDHDYPGVKRAAADLQSDLEKVTNVKPAFLTNGNPPTAIIVGTIGKSAIIDQLITTNKINVSGIAGNWESTLIEVVNNPVPGVESALVIAGSDKRGTIYGIYELSAQIGVSPWYYWADVPIQKKESLYALPGRNHIQSPAVKYRGIFLNDEAPALSGWAHKEFGGFNHKFYEKVFELILRLKGNYLWPAMWGSAFNDDDKLNPVKAEEYGIVIGTSHHEPLTRAHDEWRRYGTGEWDYTKNEENLKAFWESGLKRTIQNEQTITIGMRGDGDEPMTEGTATALLEKIVKDQREIIEKVSGKPASETPQVWALYKEVQDYYDKGMRVPDDVILLLCDDNWGNLRKLPSLKEEPRAGGYGIYYHFDYVGGPRNYKWINTNPIQKVWQQMNLAYEYDANKLWVVNVGDLKPMEFPISFFLDYAWNPDALPYEKLNDYTERWAKQQFGAHYAPQIAELLNLYSKFNGRRKPELLNENTYSLVNYNEFERVVDDYKQLVKKAEYINENIEKNQQDAFYQLVLHPIIASSNLHELYLSVAKNHLYASQKRNTTNKMAEEVKTLFEKDSLISYYYNKVLANGKWDHMMDQTHIGYTYWQQPPYNVIPKTQTIEVPQNGEIGVSIEGGSDLPTFYSASSKTHFIELFNTGTVPLPYTIEAPDYLHVSRKKGDLSGQERIYLSVDWQKVPSKTSGSALRIKSGKSVVSTIPITISQAFKQPGISGFVEQDGYIAIEAVNFSKAVNRRPLFWKVLPGYGKTTGGVTTVPVTAPRQQLNNHTPRLEYAVYVEKAGSYHVHTYISPTIDFKNADGLRFALSVDDSDPVVVNISTDYQSDRSWEKSVAENIKIFKTTLNFDTPGKHTVKYWMVDSGVVLEKIVIDTGGLKPSYLGPQETYVHNP